MPGDPSKFEQDMQGILDKLFEDHPPADLDGFLLPEGDPALFNQGDEPDTPQAPVRAKGGRANKAGQPLWIAKSHEVNSKKKLFTSATHWSTDLDKVYPDYLRLPERMKTLLDQRSIHFPELEPMMVRLDQSQPGVSTSMCPCITPGGAYWIAHQCRLARGIELMRMQGFLLNEQAMHEWPNVLLQDSAGNWFCVTSAMIFIVLAMVGVARIQRSQANQDLYFDPDESEVEESQDR